MVNCRRLDRYAVVAILSAIVSLAASAQTAGGPSRISLAGAPRLVKFSGVLRDASGQLLNGTVSISFSVYGEFTAGTALWEETQNVLLSDGTYTVLLGKNTSTGIPAELFSFGQTRWVGARILTPDEGEQPRVQLANARYTLNAADADTLRGLPAAAFMPAPSKDETGQRALENPFSYAPPPVTCGTCTANYIPVFTDSSGDLANSLIYQTGSNVGIGTTTPSAKLALVDPGVFTNTTQETPYLQALINGINITGMLYSSSNGCCSTVDATSGGVLIPNNSTVTGGTGIAGYADNYCSTGSSGHHCNGDGGFFVSRASANGAYAWGINPVVGDLNSSIHGHGLTGVEIDMNGLGAPEAFRGLAILGMVGPSFTMPGLGKAYGLAIFAPQRIGGGGAPYPNGIVVAQGATSGNALQLYPICGLAGNPSCSSQYILLQGQLSGAYKQAVIQADQKGNLLLSPQAGQAVTVSGDVHAVDLYSNASGGGLHGVFLQKNGVTNWEMYSGSANELEFNNGTSNVASLTQTGTFTAAVKNFKIDHPLDPANKYLYHTSVESPDMKNIYDGVTTLDSSGEAEIDLPDWFEALNKDFRYQLTCIGGFAPVYVAQEVENNRFRIAGGTPGLKVSWQLTGIRHDAYAEAHRSPVEQEKPANERGHYLHPALFGASAAQTTSTH
jgi:hypothetical protein